MVVLVTILRWLVAIVGMGAVAYIAWRLVNRQEAKDTEFQKKLDADDERASKGRFGAAAQFGKQSPPQQQPPPPSNPST